MMAAITTMRVANGRANSEITSADQKRTARATMNDPFPGHHPRPVSVETLDGIEHVAMAIQQLHEAMTATSATHRWLATSMMSDEVANILKMIQVDQQQFAAQGLRDMSDQFVTRPATEDEVRQWHERR
jgi:hypothetical protein